MRTSSRRCQVRWPRESRPWRKTRGLLLSQWASGPPFALKLNPKNQHENIEPSLVGIGSKIPQQRPVCLCIFNAVTTANQGLTTDDAVAAALDLHADDVLLAGGSNTTLDMLKGTLVSRFMMSDVCDESQMPVMHVTFFVQARSPVITQVGCTRGLLILQGHTRLQAVSEVRGMASSCSWCNRNRATWTRRPSDDVKLLSAASWR